jgi:ISXO2-like transposase domain
LITKQVLFGCRSLRSKARRSASSLLKTEISTEVYLHYRINHSEKVYVVGTIHTNTIEGFWSLVKRGLGGVYHAVSKKYLQSYLNEYSFRYNRRDSVTPMFSLMLARVSETAAEKPYVVVTETPAS